jgi:uncharacterized protein (DUF608 family)
MFNSSIHLVIKKVRIYLTGVLIFSSLIMSRVYAQPEGVNEHKFNSTYSGEYLNRVAFPIGGIGAGMLCIEGNGSFSHVSVRNTPDIFNAPFMFAAISVKGVKNGAKILEGPVQSWKIFGDPWTGNGSKLFGCPRFEKASFSDRFPFGTVHLEDSQIPVEVNLTGWSPFIPTDADNSSLPVGGLEYTFKNNSDKELECVFSFNSENFMRIEAPSVWGGNYVGKDSIMQMDKGFILEQSCFPDKPYYKGEFAIFTDEPGAIVDYCWFRGGWFDSKTVLWKNIETCNTPSNPVSAGATGASLFIPVKLKPNETRTVRVYLAWHVPHSDIRIGEGSEDDKKSKIEICTPGSSCCSSEALSANYEPWYYSKFKDVREVSNYWFGNYKKLKNKSGLFTDTFYNSDLPSEVLEAVAANLSILKSPTVLRQKDGKLWGWEGCFDLGGCCSGSCTHVWNYAQAISHLFPGLERSLRETEFDINQNDSGHQNFRGNLPIRPAVEHTESAAADGQLGGIMKMYREWRISGDKNWLKKLWPNVKSSMDYCIGCWDPRHTGALEEPQHNTYDIEFWGPNGMCTGFYLGALTAFIKMSDEVGDNSDQYKTLLEKGKRLMESELFNGEYFIQKVKWEGLNVHNPVEASKKSIGTTYSAEELEVMEKEGPKYQYGAGCLSDGVLGLWLAKISGIDDNIIDESKVKSHLLAVYNNNLKLDLSNHANPQRAGYAFGKEGGLLLCSWPNGGQPTFPFPYSNEVWTGIEYQVASHLMSMGEIEKGLEIVREVRKRYDGRIRNPFDEYECGHWYARAMSSYGLLQGLTGIRYDAVDQTLYIDSKVGDNFTSFISTETGFGNAGLKNGKPFIQVKYGSIDIKKCFVSNVEQSLIK